MTELPLVQSWEGGDSDFQKGNSSQGESEAQEINDHSTVMGLI